MIDLNILSEDRLHWLYSMSLQIDTAEIENSLICETGLNSIKKLSLSILYITQDY